MAETTNFIEQIINEELESGKVNGGYTRFPPEPNGYLHIGHAKSLCLNFGIKEKYNGKCNLFFDDTNPSKEKTEFVDAIKEDIKWLGFKWDKETYASDYFENIYAYAVELIKKGKAFVCDMSPEEISACRGTLTEPGKESPARNRSVEENLELFAAMREGKFADGEKCLRAKIDMASPNINMRDPVIYRILRRTHHRTGDKWCIYPMYYFAHPICDYMQGVTHSLCTLEFEDHRPLYDWVGIELGFSPKPRQIEFARLNVTNLVMSKRYLKKLVEENFVDGWDDPRMPTLCGLRRRGYTAASILDFCDRIGVSKANSMVDIGLLEHCIREELNNKAPRRVAVLHPVKLIVDNYPDDKVEYFDLPNNQNDPEAGTRKVPFCKELYIDTDDFAEVPPPKFFRMKPDGEVRLMGGYIVKCTSVEKDPDGNIVAIHCDADLVSGNGNPFDGRKIKGTIHWVSARHAIDIGAIMYDRLFTRDNMNDLPEGTTYIDYINPDSAIRLDGVKAEPSLADAKPGEKFQFVRTGYFCVDTKNGCFNRVASLKDSFKV